MIIGITGSFGAGKGEVVDYLVQQQGFRHYSASGFITEELLRTHMTVNRDSMIRVGNELRAQFGPAYIVEALYTKAMEQGGDAVIESLRVVAEVKRIKELGGIVIGIDADPAVRYKRAFGRGSEKDHVTFEEWLVQEKQESNPTDPTKQHIFGALKESDYIIQNNGTKEDLHREIDAIFEKIKIKSE